MSAPQVNVHPTAIGANVKPHTESRQESYPSSTTATTGHRTDPLHANSPSTKTSTNETQFGRETYPSSTTATTGHHTDSLHNPSSVRTSANETQFGRESYPSSNATTMGHHTDSLHNNSPSVNTSTTTGTQFGRESHPSSNATTMGHHTDSLHNSSPSVNTSTTETHPRKESHPSSTTATMDHHTDSVHNNSPSVKTSTTETPYNGTTEKTNAASSTTNATEGVTAPNNEPYPEQRHAGAVGYGPNYNKGATFTEKLTGLKEEVVGKMTKNPEKVEHGRELRTGAVKKREQEEDLNAPFGKAAEEKEVQHGAVTEDHERVSGPHATEHAKAHDDTLHRSKHGLDDPEHVHATERAATVAPEGTALGDRQKSGIHGHSMKHIG